MDNNNNNKSNNNSFMPTPTPTPPSSDIVGGWDALLSDLPGSESFASDTADAAPSQIIPSQQTQQPTLQQPQDNNNNHNNDDLQDLTSDPTLSDLLRDDSFPVNLNPTSSQGPTSPLPQQQQQQQHQDTTDVSSSTVSSSSSSSYHNTKSPFFAVSPHHHYRHHHHNNNTTNNNPSVSTATEASQYDDDNDNYRAMDDDDDLQHARSSSNDHQNIIINNNNNTTPQKKKYRLQLPETLMVRTQSRAHVDAASSPRSPASKHSTASASASASATTSHQEPLHMIRIYEDEEVMHYHTRLVKKRVRVVQLLVFGLMGLVLGFFGGLFVQGSCHFATARMIVGQSEQPFTSSYGLWKYRPIDNVFQGQSYCLNYGRYSDETPHVARIAGVLAVMAGTYSMAVLWTYLISGRASHQYWKWAVRAAVVSGVLQALTLVFFVSGVCLNESCTPGPGAIVSIVSTIAWFVLGYELHYNRPINEHLPELQPASTDDSAFVKNLEMADFQQGANDYLMRMHGGAITPRYQPPGAMSSLNGAQRANDQPLGQLLSEVRSPVASVTGAQRFPSP